MEKESWFNTILAGIVVFGIMEIAEQRYTPDNFIETIVGYFVLPGELLTGRDDIYPRIIDSLHQL